MELGTATASILTVGNIPDKVQTRWVITTVSSYMLGIVVPINTEYRLFSLNDTENRLKVLCGYTLKVVTAECDTS